MSMLRLTGFVLGAMLLLNGAASAQDKVSFRLNWYLGEIGRASCRERVYVLV